MFFHYGNQNVRFVFDLIGKRNVCIGTKNAQNGLDV